MFLVDDDQRQIGRWRKDSRAGADDDVGLATTDAVPLGSAFCAVSAECNSAT